MWCMFHRWSKWKDIRHGDLLSSDKSKIPCGMYITQERVCAKCNKRERNVIMSRY
jgi:hypothetical protein